MELYLLYLQIEMLRKRLERIAEDKERTHPLVLAMSRKLDGLIVEYMRKGDNVNTASCANAP